MNEQTAPLDNSTAGVIAPPPLIFIGVLLVGLAIDRLWLGSSFDMPVSLRWTLALSLVAAGAVFIVLAMARFRAAGTPPEPWKPTQGLVIEGVYRRTRNPMYVGFSFVYLGLAVGFDGVVSAFLLIAAMAITRFGVIAREERYMEGRFGQPYRDYMASTPRWL